MYIKISIEHQNQHPDPNPNRSIQKAKATHVTHNVKRFFSSSSKVREDITAAQYNIT
jgi:hypothetical protein